MVSTRGISLEMVRYSCTTGFLCVHKCGGAVEIEKKGMIQGVWMGGLVWWRGAVWGSGVD